MPPAAGSGKKLNVPKTLFALAAAAYFWRYAGHYAAVGGLWDSVDLAFHEAGHTLLAWGGEWLRIAGGTIMQLAVPVACSAYFFLRRQPYSGSLLLYWLGQSFLNVYIYAADAVRMELPLLGGDGVGHDWNNLLSMAGLLNHTATIAGFFYVSALASIGIGTVLSLYFSLEDKAS